MKLAFQIGTVAAFASFLLVLLVALNYNERSRSAHLVRPVLLAVGARKEISRSFRSMRKVARFSELEAKGFGYDYAPDSGYEYSEALPPSSWSLENFDGRNFYGPTSPDPTSALDGDYWLAAANSEALDCMSETGEDSFDCVAEPSQVIVFLYRDNIKIDCLVSFQGELSYTGVRSGSWCSSPACDIDSESSSDLLSFDYDSFAS